MGRRRSNLWADAEAANKAALASYGVMDEDDLIDDDELIEGELVIDPQTGEEWMVTAEDIANYEEEKALKESKSKKEGGVTTVYVNGQPVKYTGPGQKIPATDQSYKPPMRPGCPEHTGATPTISLYGGEVVLSGAQGPRLQFTQDTRLILDCAGAVRFPNYDKWLKRGPGHLIKALRPEPPPTPPPVVEVDWPDRGVPMVPIAWWTKLMHVIRTEYAGHVIVACIGGHGRTGTALAAMCLVANPKLGVEEAINFVRTHHCFNAVESDAQVEYLWDFRPDEDSEWLRKEAGFR
jgi:hypothetical protein